MWGCGLHSVGQHGNIIYCRCRAQFRACSESRHFLHHSPPGSSNHPRSLAQYTSTSAGWSLYTARLISPQYLMCSFLPTLSSNLCQTLAWQHIPQLLQQTSNMGSFCSSLWHWQEWACVYRSWLLAKIADQIVKSPQTFRQFSLPPSKMWPRFICGAIPVISVLRRQSLMWLQINICGGFSPVQTILSL